MDDRPTARLRARRGSGAPARRSVGTRREARRDRLPGVASPSRARAAARAIDVGHRRTHGAVARRSRRAAKSPQHGRDPQWMINTCRRAAAAGAARSTDGDDGIRIAFLQALAGRRPSRRHRRSRGKGSTTASTMRGRARPVKRIREQLDVAGARRRARGRCASADRRCAAGAGLHAGARRSRGTGAARRRHRGPARLRHRRRRRRAPRLPRRGALPREQVGDGGRGTSKARSSASTSRWPASRCGASPTTRCRSRRPSTSTIS